MLKQLSGLIWYQVVTVVTKFEGILEDSDRYSKEEIFRAARFPWVAIYAVTGRVQSSRSAVSMA